MSKKEITPQQKAEKVLEHIRLMTHLKLSVLEAQCSIPQGHLSKQLSGKDFMRSWHYDKLYAYLVKTSFKG